MESFFESSGSKKRSYEYLLEVEKNRRNLLKSAKDFNTKGMYYLFKHFDGTILPSLIRSRLFWLTFIIYITVRALIRTGAVGYEQFPQLNLSFLGIAGGFLSFFLAFFANQSYTRFEIQYDNSSRVIGKILNVCYLARSLLPTHELWRLVRYLNAVHLLGYCGLSSCYEEDNMFHPFNNKEKLLTEWEVNRLREIGLDDGANCFNEVIVWSMDVIDQHAKGSEIRVVAVTNEILQLANSIGILYAFDDQPIPFIYVHTLFLMSFIYMPMVAYTLASNLFENPTFNALEEIFGVMMMLIFLMFTEGLISIGRCP